MNNLKSKSMNRTITRTAQGLAIMMALFCATATAAISDCNLTISQMQMDYGKLNKASQNFQMTPQGNITSLAQRTVSVLVSCPEPEQIKLLFSGPKTSGQQFALGQNAGVKVTLENATLDGNSVPMRNVTAGTGEGSPLNSQIIKPDSVISAGANNTVSGKNFVGVVNLQPLVKESAFNMQDAQKLMTQLKISLVE